MCRKVCAEILIAGGMRGARASVGDDCGHGVARSDAGPGSGRDVAVQSRHVAFLDPTNWTTGTVPTGTAFFGATTVPALTVTGGPTVVGGWTFNAGAPAYTFPVGPGALTFNGAGIVINAGSATIINQNFGAVTFSGTSTAGSATITQPEWKRL